VALAVSSSDVVRELNDRALQPAGCRQSGSRMLKKFPALGSKFHHFVSCAILALALAACNADNSGGIAVQTATSSAASQPFVVSAVPRTLAQVGTMYKYIAAVSTSEGGKLPSYAGGGRVLSFAIVNKPEWATFIESSGELSGIPAASDVGTTGEIQIDVSDGTAHATVGPFRIRVLAQPTAPGAPAISGTPAVTVAAGSNYSFTPVAGDASGNALIFSILNGPSWATFSASTGQLSGTPQSADVGTYLDILITVSDGHASALLPAFAIQVTPVVVVTPAQKLLSYMKGLTGKGILSGQYANYNVSGMMNQVPLITGGTGQTPAILGTFLSLGDSTFNADPIALSNQWLAKGGIVLAMLSPGNPTHSATIIGGSTQSTQRPNGYPVNFNNLLIPGTVEYTRWQAFLALLVSEFKAINGPIIVRPFPELNSDWKWWGVQPPAQFIAVWQQMVMYVRNAGVTNVLWCLNFGATALPAGYPDLGAVVRAYYPGDAYVDIVSLDSYPPSPANSAAIAALTATGKPVIFSEMGAVKGPIPAQEFSGDTSAALAALISNYPQVVAAVVWPGTEALPVQNGMDAFMANPKIVNLTGLPPL
jgi:hypothetical protein